MANGDMLGVGISGLLAFQRALSTTGHNISNANTAGYNRQVVDMATQPPQYAGNGYIGTGVMVTTVKRMYDQFLTSQIQGSTSSQSQMEGYYALASQVDGLLADTQTGLSPSMQEFYKAVQVVANDPGSISGRQVLLSQANTLADRFHYLDQRLSDIDANANAQIKTSITEINNLAVSIAGLNRAITQSPGQGSSPPPNDLLDQRDQLIARLAQHVAVNTVPQNDGAVNVFIGNGQTLVIGSQAQSLTALVNEYNPTRSEIGYTSGANTVNISSQITGGTLGGLLQFRAEVLDPARNGLGRVAMGFSADFDAQHLLGQDLDGNLGTNFFNAIDASSPTARASSNNSLLSTAVITVTVSDTSKLTTSDYRLAYAGGNYTVTRLSDNATVYSAAAFPGTVAAEGLTFSLAGSAVAGDSFLIQPTRQAAADVAVSLTDTRRIAAAAPIRTAVTLANTGTGKISAGSVSNTTSLPLAGNITLTFDSLTNQFTVAGGPGGTLAYNPATEGGGKTFTFAGYGGSAFTLSGTPANGDSFVISNNTNGAGDNRNALLLAGLQAQPTLANSTANYQDAYGQIVADVGSRTHSADMNRQAQSVLLEQSKTARASISGVNLDEEAADLVRFQQAYQAAAQVISIADSLFQTLITAVRR